MKGSFMPDSLTLADEIKQLLTVIDRAEDECLSILRERERAEPHSGWCVVVPDPTEDLPDPILKLAESIDSARSAAHTIFDRLIARPIALLMRGSRLSREQFHLLLARDALLFPSVVETASGDLYETFLMFHYEDDEQRCYINPNERPHLPEQIRIRLGIPPEEILWVRLRPEQQSYFERNLPDVAARFKRQEALST
jgi:hypothetical protein